MDTFKLHTQSPCIRSTFTRIRFYIGCFVILTGMIRATYGSDRYFLCGPDEDGCYDGIYQYCACIPYDDLTGDQPYCLDFNLLTCTPLSRVPDCPASLTFKNQGECLGTIFQSEPLPPCPLTTHSFCLEHHISICDSNGQPDSCRET
ncbi:hypothetical protein [Legionella spiritensis]|uniref:hypothetical protein n=1 Tax=Legionella spiritensis TaxID=452 RepID=UPI000F7083AC|nr:hypothetical protein [Legionella spiritensis]VEG90285.1 Uncharacterised protein [Legionella spiritensis]